MTVAESTAPGNGANPSRSDLASALAVDAFSACAAGGCLGGSGAGFVRLLARVQSALCDGLPIESVLGVRYRRSVAIECLGIGDAIPAGGAKFGFRVRIGGGDDLACVIIDRSAAEALAAVFMAFYAPLRGYGDPSRVETALLEFATLLMLTDLRRASLAVETDTTFHSFLEKGDLSSAESRRGTPIGLRVSVDQREGRATLYVPGIANPSPVRVLPLAQRVDARLPIGLRLALPAIEITRDEWREAALGDALLIGASEFAALGARCAIASETGWRVAAATIVADTSTFIGVESAALAPEPLAMTPSERGVQVVPVMGQHRATVDQIANWSNRQRIEFAKPAALPISLVANGVELARGELVRVEGELGIRLGAIYRKELP